MAEKESPKGENKAKKEKTIVLSEWQKKNQAYLERRAKEKAEKEAKEHQKKAEQQAKLEELKQAAQKVHENSQESQQKEASEITDDPAANQEAKEQVSKKEKLSSDKKGGKQESVDEALASVKEVGPSEEEQTAKNDQNIEKPLPTAVQKSNQSAEQSLPALTKKTKKARQSDGRTWRTFFKALPVLMGAFLLLVASLYFISPWSRLKTIEVLGNAQVSKDDVMMATGISEQDYTLTTFINQEQYARQVEDQLLWVKAAQFSYHFPYQFELQIEEYKMVGYVKDGADFYPVLTSGQVIDKAVTESEVKPNYLIFQLTDLAMIKSFVLILEELDDSLLPRIETVTLSPTAASSDLLNLTMRDGHTVLVPLSGLEDRMAYYDRIASHLSVASVVDMEAGIYSYAK